MAEEEEQEQLDPKKILGVYEGERNAQDERHGYGVNRFPNGDVYKGLYERGVRQGEGKYYWKTPGAIYQGTYVNHKKEGHGLMRYPDGSVYEGEFHEGHRHGEGKYTYPNGDTYEGQWYQGKKHGKGVFTMKKENSVYTGIWFLGQLKRGVWDIKDGSYYVGLFDKQRPNKEGKYVMVNRNAVTGRFREETKTIAVPIEKEKKEGGGEEEEQQEEEEEGKKEPTTKNVDKITLRQFIPVSFTTLTPEAVAADHDVEPEEGELDIPVEQPKKTRKRINENGEEEEVEEEEEQGAEEDAE